MKSEFGMRNGEVGMRNAEIRKRNVEVGKRNEEFGMRKSELERRPPARRGHRGLRPGGNEKFGMMTRIPPHATRNS
jgi:hypothetical protein